MITVAMVTTTGVTRGHVVYVCQPNNDNDYTDRTEYGAHTAIFIPNDSDINNYLDSKIWSFDNNAWVDKAVSPGDGYIYNPETNTWATPPEDYALASTWNTARRMRDMLLLQTDVTQLSDFPITAEKKAAFATYRQQLRDTPQAQSSVDKIENIVWPTHPDEGGS